MSIHSWLIQNEIKNEKGDFRPITEPHSNESSTDRTNNVGVSEMLL